MMNRRSFLQGTVAGAVISNVMFHNGLGVAGAQDAADAVTGQGEVIVNVFLRGGADYLNWLPPMGGDDRRHYETARSRLFVPAEELLGLDGSELGLHPAAAPMAELFEEGALAIVLGAGHTADTRSHFDAQRLMDYGGHEVDLRSGWMARLLGRGALDGGALPASLLPAVALNSATPDSFATSNRVIALPNLNGFGFPGEFSQWQAAQRSTLRAIYESNDSGVHRAGLRAIEGSNVLELNAGNEYTPASGVEYQGDEFGRSLATIAQLIKLDLGMTAVSIDIGGWDTHTAQGDGSGGFFSQQVGEVANGLHAFYADLADTDHAGRTTVVVQSEFGRRLRENANGGTDHGHGGLMFVMGGSVNGGFHGEWPGLDQDQLYQRADVAVTTDYRRVLSDIIIRRFGDNRLGALFPGYENHEPLGVVEGADMDPDYTSELPDPAELEEAEEAVGPVTGAAGGTAVEAGTDSPVTDTNDGSGDSNDTQVALIAGGIGLGAGVAGTAAVAALLARRKRMQASATTPEPNTGAAARRVDLTRPEHGGNAPAGSQAATAPAESSPVPPPPAGEPTDAGLPAGSPSGGD
jgi:uncharacterized protein (DUF1501 family)